MGQVAERERRAVTLYAEGIISSGACMDSVRNCMGVF